MGEDSVESVSKNIREQLEKNYPKKPGVFNKVKTFLGNYMEESPKDIAAFFISGELPLPLTKETKKRILTKLNLPDYTDKMYDKERVNNFLQKKQYLKAYEAFYETWNPPARRIFQNTYNAVGGDKKPVRAGLAAMAHNVFNHTAITALPIYAAELVAGYANAIPYTAGAIAAVFTVMGAPVIYSKWRNRVEQNKAK
ncbi:MAG: hypothetical protein V1836_02440 [Candidatus Aenigmatarchaeota archaeon]